MSDQTRFILNEIDLPKNWYNIHADSPVPPTPVLHPSTLEPVTPDFLSVLFPMDLILQEISTERQTIVKVVGVAALHGQIEEMAEHGFVRILVIAMGAEEREQPAVWSAGQP